MPYLAMVGQEYKNIRRASVIYDIIRPGLFLQDQWIDAVDLTLFRDPAGNCVDFTIIIQNEQDMTPVIRHLPGCVFMQRT